MGETLRLRSGQAARLTAAGTAALLLRSAFRWNTYRASIDHTQQPGLFGAAAWDSFRTCEEYCRGGRADSESLWNNHPAFPPAWQTIPIEPEIIWRTSALFLAWVRTGVAVVVFGFAIGRFSIAIRQFSVFQGKPMHSSGIAVWIGMLDIFAG